MLKNVVAVITLPTGQIYNNLNGFDTMVNVKSLLNDLDSLVNAAIARLKDKTQQRSLLTMK